jgi:DNA-binding NarL/FixJ family response regulator
MRISIVIVDDNPQNRISLAERIKPAEEINLLFISDSGNDFLNQMKKLPAGKIPDVVLMDFEMPGLNGSETIRQALALYPDVKFLILTVFDDEEKIFEAIKAGASGYLLKDEKVGVIIEWIRELVEIGGAPMSPRIARKAMNLLMNVSPDQNRELKKDPLFSDELSDREIEVLKLLVDGHDYKMTAEKLFLSTHTVRKHIANIYKKLHVNSKAQALRLAYTKGLI